MTDPTLLPRTAGQWARFAAVCVILTGAVYVSWLVIVGYQEDRESDRVLISVAEVVEGQQESAASTECAREINSAGELAQIETLATLRAGLLDLIDDNEVSQATVAQVQSLDLILAEAKAAYEEINERCPVPGSIEQPDGNTND